MGREIQWLCEENLVCVASTFLVDKEANLSAESEERQILETGGWIGRCNIVISERVNELY